LDYNVLGNIKELAKIVEEKALSFSYNDIGLYPCGFSAPTLGKGLEF
jgi:hypothetical protein